MEPQITPSPSSDSASESQFTKFDIVLNLPPELLLELLDRFTEPEVILLRRVSKGWKERIEAFKKDKVCFLLKTARESWPDGLPMHVEYAQLSRTLQYLEVSAWRIKDWKDNLGSSCPVLKTFIIQDVCEAPLDGAMLLQGSAIQVLRLNRITIQHCEWWLPYLSSCKLLKELTLSLMIWGVIATTVRAPTQDQRPQELMPSLQTLRIEGPANAKDPDAGNASRWMEEDFVPSNDFQVPETDEPDDLHSPTKQSLALCAALSNLRRHSPRFRSFTTAIDREPNHLHTVYILKPFIRDLHLDGVRVEHVLLEDHHCRPVWLTGFKSVEFRNLAVGSFWHPLWDSEIESLSITYDKISAHHYFRSRPLAQNLRSLKLSDPEGMLVNGLFWHLGLGHLPGPLVSLQNLSLSRCSPVTLSPEEDVHFPAGRNLPWDYKNVDAGDIMRLTYWFPNLVFLEMIRICTLDEANVGGFLVANLPHLEHLDIERLE